SATLDQVLQMNAVRSNSVNPRLADQTETPQFKIRVSNPEPGGGDSPDPADPSISQLEPQNPVPVLVSISPTEISAVSGSSTVALNGNNFNASSVVHLGGIQHFPSVSSSTS